MKLVSSPAAGRVLEKANAKLRNFLLHHIRIMSVFSVEEGQWFYRVAPLLVPLEHDILPSLETAPLATHTESQIRHISSQQD